MNIIGEKMVSQKQRISSIRKNEIKHEKIEKQKVQRAQFFNKLIEPAKIILCTIVVGAGIYTVTKETIDFVKKTNNINQKVEQMVPVVNNINNNVLSANVKLALDIIPVLNSLNDRIVKIDKENGEVVVKLNRDEMASFEVTLVEEKRASIFSKILPWNWFKKSQTKKVEKKVGNVDYKVTSNEKVNAIKNEKSEKPEKVTTPQSTTIKVIKPKE